MATRTIAGEWIDRLVGAHPEERRALLVSFAYFFCLLCGYYVLRPLREEMGIVGGVQHLHWLFTATFISMLAAVPLFGWITSRFSRTTFLPVVYLFFIANLLLFFAAFQFEPARFWTARVFFVWISVFNLFVVSVFWSLMADLYSDAQGRRLFGFIAAGGSIGAITGPLLTALLVGPLGTTNLLLVSGAFLVGALVCMRTLTQRVRREKRPEEAFGGGIWEGITTLARSRYLLGVALFIVGLTVVATFVYFEQAHVVKQTFTNSAERTRFFASIDLAVNGIAVALQLFGTGRLVQRFGLTSVLSFMPLVTTVGLLLLGAMPVIAVLAAFQVLRRAGDYALTRPAREVLFTVVPRVEKYKSKNVIDTVVYRGGDALGGWVFAGLTSLGFGLAGVAYVGAAIALAWFVLALWLGREENRYAKAMG